MPTYEYTCKQCSENFEIFQSFTDKPLKRHRDCGGDLQKVFHARGVVFKGSGFYITDSRGASTTGSSSDSSTTPSTDSKSAEKKSKPSSAPAEAAKS